jgi:excisionase family DNA binding protein
MALLTYNDAATLLRLPVGTVHAMVSQRRIPHVRLGPRLVRFVEAELLAWIETRHVRTGCGERTK